MRTRLSKLITMAAKEDPKVIVLSGDHGYSLFDELRSECPDQFLNCGVAEQGMVGIAAGLCRQGFKPVVYGLAAFIPMRTLEQIKLDVCFSNLPIIFLGDGAGVVYSTLGASHHCAEDVAALRPLPNISIYSPCDENELSDCFRESISNTGPSYIRIGKSDRPTVAGAAGGSTRYWITNMGAGKRTCVVSTGSMVSPATEAAKKLGVTCISVPKIKPSGSGLIYFLSMFQNLIVVEEHSEHGGLYSELAEQICKLDINRPRIIPLSLKDRFADKCGSYQYALSEHEMDDASIERRIRQITDG